jgi:4-hydroxymandelate synthase
MDIHSIDHVEFQVADARRTALDFRTAYGLRSLGEGGPETGLAGQRSLLLGAGRIRLLVTQGVGPADPVHRAVLRHGGGATCLAMRTDDVAAAVAEAVGEGARVVEPPRTWRAGDAVVVWAAVDGPGVTHRFVERHPADAGFLPGAITGGEGDPEPAEPLLDSIDHVALCVGAGELEPTVRFYERVLGFRQIFQERVEIGGQAMDSAVVQSRSAQVTITIVAPDPVAGSRQLEDFLRGFDGPGIQHLALSTRDIVAAVRTCGERGVRFLRTPDSYYDGIARRLGTVDLSVAALRAGNILVDRDHWGELFQIFAESPFERGTFFFELIERHGARGFGGNNIRALYEAKERARSGVEARS